MCDSGCSPSLWVEPPHDDGQGQHFGGCLRIQQIADRALPPRDAPAMAALASRLDADDRMPSISVATFVRMGVACKHFWAVDGLWTVINGLRALRPRLCLESHCCLDGMRGHGQSQRCTACCPWCPWLSRHRSWAGQVSREPDDAFACRTCGGFRSSRRSTKKGEKPGLKVAQVSPRPAEARATLELPTQCCLLHRVGRDALVGSQVRWHLRQAACKSRQA